METPSFKSIFRFWMVFAKFGYPLFRFLSIWLKNSLEQPTQLDFGAATGRNHRVLRLYFGTEPTSLRHFSQFFGVFDYYGVDTPEPALLDSTCDAPRLT